jgi:hypothetical protein
MTDVAVDVGNGPMVVQKCGHHVVIHVSDPSGVNPAPHLPLRLCLAFLWTI